jgi:hypothetical protein
LRAVGPTTNEQAEEESERKSGEGEEMRESRNHLKDTHQRRKIPQGRRAYENFSFTWKNIYVREAAGGTFKQV